MADQQYQYPAADAVTLPNLFATPGEALKQRSDLMERKSERDAQLAQQKAAQQEKYGLTNLKNLNDATDKLNLPLGNDYANTVMGSEAKKVYQNLIDKANTLDPTTFDYLLHRETDNLFGWEKQFRQDLEFTQKYTDDILKGNSNLDVNKTKQVAQSQLENKYFDLQNGEWVRKHPDAIMGNQNPVAALSDPKMQGYLAVGGEDVIRKAVQSAKPQALDYHKYASDKGFVNAEDYDIGINPMVTEVTHDEYGKPQLKRRTEDVTLGKDITLKMLPEETFDEYMKSPDFNSAFHKLWNPKGAAIEQKAASEGVNILDPHSEKMLQRDFLRQVIDDGKMDLSFIQPKVKQVIPKPPVTHNTFNFGQQQPQFNPQTSGTELDRIGNVKPLHFDKTGVTISKGVVVDKNGQPYTGEDLVVPKSDLPTGLLSILKSSGVEFGDDKYWNVKVENGRIEAIKPTEGNWVDRQDVFNFQLKNDTEPIKSTQPVYGNKKDNQQKPTTSKNEFDQYKRNH